MLQPVGIAHDLERELRIDRRAVRGLRRPRQENPEQPALEQQRVRLRISGGRCGQFMPSTGANIGSLPSVSCQRRRIVSTDSDIAFAGWWQVTQARPFSPIGSKNGWPFVITGPDVFRTPSCRTRCGTDASAASGLPSPGAHQSADDDGALSSPPARAAPAGSAAARAPADRWRMPSRCTGRRSHAAEQPGTGRLSEIVLRAQPVLQRRAVDDAALALLASCTCTAMYSSSNTLVANASRRRFSSGMP